jgi:hypothetical protein
MSTRIYNTSVFEETGRKGVFARGFGLPYFYTIITPIDFKCTLLFIHAGRIRSLRELRGNEE